MQKIMSKTVTRLTRLFIGFSLSILLHSDAVGDVGWGPEGRCFLSSADLTVTIQPSSGSIQVFDRGNGLTWAQRAHASHTAFLNVTFLTNENAIRFQTTYFADPDTGDRFSVAAWTELRLTGRKLAMQVGFEDTNTPLNSINFIEPFQPAENMSLVVPDFCDGHIYPCNLDSWPRFNLDSIKILNLPMPWVGVVDLVGGQGYSVIFDTPCDAQLKLSKFEELRSPQVAWNGEKGRFGYTRSVSYHFTARGGYVALAKAYREHAKAEGLLIPLAAKAQSRTNITKLYGAPVLWDFNHRVSDTELRTRGVLKAIHHVERWDGNPAGLDQLVEANRLGFVTEEYDYYLGGKVDGGIQRYQDYHIRTNECARDLAGNILSVEKFGTRCPAFYEPLGRQILPERLRQFPQSARYFDQITQNYNGHDNGPRGGGSTDECWDPSHPKTRRQWVEDVDNFYRYAAQELGLLCGAELGKYHQTPNTEIFFGMESYFWPWSDVTYPGSQSQTNSESWKTYEAWAVNPTVRVPLWQLVFHDCAIATWYPWDGNDICHKLNESYQDQKDCFNVLYGTPATFMVTDGAQSQYFSNPSRWLQSYRNTCKSLEVLASREMTHHRFLTPDRLVQQTEWSDGTRVIANFGAADWRVESGQSAPQILKQFCFMACGPWGQAIRSYDTNGARIVTHLRVPGYTFDDVQSCEGRPVALSQYMTGTNALRINVDALQGQTNVSFVIHPAALQPAWDYRSTHIFLCNSVDGARVKEIPFKLSGDTGIAVAGLKSWIVLDVVCSQP